MKESFLEKMDKIISEKATGAGDAEIARGLAMIADSVRELSRSVMRLKNALRDPNGGWLPGDLG